MKQGIASVCAVRICSFNPNPNPNPLFFEQFDGIAKSLVPIDEMTLIGMEFEGSSGNYHMLYCGIRELQK